MEVEQSGSRVKDGIHVDSNPRTELFANVSKVMLEVVDRLQKSLAELEHARISDGLDYSREGVGALSDAFLKARAFSERASALQADMIRQRTRARIVVGRLRDARQDQFDRVVVENAKSHPDLSWEERGSYYRVKLIDWDIALRQADRLMAQVDALCEAIDVLSRSIWRARGDLEPLLHTLRMGDNLRELA